MVATRLTGRDEPTRSGRSEPAAAGHPPITALLGSVRGTSGGRDGEGGAVKRATATQVAQGTGDDHGAAATHGGPHAIPALECRQGGLAGPPPGANPARGEAPRLGAASAASTQSFNLSLIFYTFTALGKICV